MQKKIDKFIPEPILEAFVKEQKNKKIITKHFIKKLSQKTNIPTMTLFEIATFYQFLKIEKKTKNIILVCDCISCELNGSQKILKKFEKELKMKMGNVNGKKTIHLETITGIGQCDNPPSILFNSLPIKNVNQKKVLEVIQKCN